MVAWADIGGDPPAACANWKKMAGRSGHKWNTDINAATRQRLEQVIGTRGVYVIARMSTPTELTPGKDVLAAAVLRLTSGASGI